MNARRDSRLLAVILCIALPLPATADDVLDEIIVSADFRERSAAALPISVTVIDADTVESASVQHFEELVNLVPNLNWSGDGHRARYFQIRGIGELEQYQGAPNPSIGFLIDDIDFSGIGTVATLFDMQSVEVLRGSQASRYGANALGGLIYLTSTAPSDERDGLLQITAAGDAAYSMGAAFGGALNEAKTTTFRLSAHTFQSDGFRNNPFLNRSDTNGRDETTLRLRLRFEPSAALTGNLSVMLANLDNGYDAFALDNSYTVLSDNPGKDAQDSIGASLKLDWEGGDDWLVTSVTAVADSDIDFGFDADWGNQDSWLPFTYDFISRNDRQRQTISQELRLSAGNWLVGLYALNLSDDLQTVNIGDYFDPFFDFADSLNDTFGSRYEATNVALFGQFDRNLTDATAIVAGLRVEHRRTDYNDTAGLLADPSESMWGGEIAINHSLNDAVSGYIAVSKGYKAGGFNLGVAPPGKRDFGAEELWTLESGIRATLLDGALRTNASVFYSKRIDQQVRTSLQLVPGDPASFVFFTDNAAKGTAAGVEAEIRWLPNEAWELYANIGFLNAEFDEFVAPQGDLSGRRQAHAPDYTLAAGFMYRHPAGAFARLDLAAKDEFYFDVSHDQRSQQFETVNARIGFEGDSWSVAIWARNLFDERYAVRGFYFGNEPPDFPNRLYTRLGDPRQAGITIEKRF